MKPVKLSAGALFLWAFVACAAMPPVLAQSAPLTVEEAVQQALGANLDLLAEKQNVPIARAREIQAALRPNPILTFSWDYLDWMRRGLSAANSAGPSEWTPQFNYIWETAGKREKRVAVARLATSVTELRLADSIRQLSLSVRLACVEYLLARDNLSLAQQNLQVFDNILQVNEAKVKAGDLAGVELIRTRVAQQQLQTAAAQARLRLQTARNNLLLLLGRKPGDPAFELSGSLSDSAADLRLDELKESALSTRPDLLALRKEKEQGLADTRLQTAIARPDITTGLMYHNQYGYSNGRTFGIFLSTELPIHERNQGEIARASRQAQQSGLRATALEASISTEVENAWQQLASARNLADRIRSSLLAEARQVRDITEFSYRRGEASLLEFLDAQRAHNDAMQSYNDARADLTRSLYLIEAISGKKVTP